MIGHTASDTRDSNVILNAAQGSGPDTYITTYYQEGGNEEFDQGIKAWITGDEANIQENGGGMKNLRPAQRDTTIDGVSATISFDENADEARGTSYIKNFHTDDGRL